MISGKFWFGCQSSDDASNFGVDYSQNREWRGCRCVEEEDSAVSSSSAQQHCNCYATYEEHLLAIADEEGIDLPTSEDRESENRLVAKLCLNRWTKSGVRHGLESLPLNSLSPQQFAFSVIDMMMNSAMEPQAEEILAYVGFAGSPSVEDLEGAVGLPLLYESDISYDFDKTEHLKTVLEALKEIEETLQTEHDFKVQDLNFLCDEENSYEYDVDAPDTDGKRGMEDLIARWCLGSQIARCLEREGSCSFSCDCG